MEAWQAVFDANTEEIDEIALSLGLDPQV